MVGEKTCNLTLSWAIEWPSWIRTSEEMMEYIKKYYRKKNMKKKMTKKEAFEYLKRCKIYVNGKSAEIQKILFETGYNWPLKSSEPKFEDQPFLYTDIDAWGEGLLLHGRDMRKFAESRFTEIKAEDVLAIEIADKSKTKEEEIIEHKVLELAIPLMKYLDEHNFGEAITVDRHAITQSRARTLTTNIPF